MTEQEFYQMTTDIAVIKSRLEDFTNVQVVRIDDHEDRLREVEDFRSKIMGAIVASGVFGGVLGAVISYVTGMIK